MSPEAAPAPEKVIAIVNDLFFEAKIGEVLRTLGIPVAFAKSEDGLAKRLAEVRPALGIVDVGARGIDAVAAIRRLRALPAPVVAFISHVQADDAARAREAGADAVYAKSGLVRELPELVMKYAGRLASGPPPA
jgi:CheY-like chemotaxis protein